MTVIFKVRNEKLITEVLKNLNVKFKVVRGKKDSKYKYVVCQYISSDRALKNRISDYLKEQNLSSFDPDDEIVF